MFRCSRSQIFFKINVLKNFTIPEPLSNKVSDLFNRTPTVAASGFSRQQILFFSYVCYLYMTFKRFLIRTPLKTRVTPQQQPLELFFKNGVLINFENFTRKHRNTCVKVSLLFHLEFTKFLRTANLKSAIECFWHLSFTWAALFNKSYGSNWYICFSFCIII